MPTPVQTQTCVQSLQQKIDDDTLSSIVRLYPSTPEDISVSPSGNQLFKITITRQEAVVFTLSLQTTGTLTNVGVQVNFYQITNNAIINLGYVQITDLVTVFEKDMLAGTFYICISSVTHTYTGTLTGQFTGFNTTPTFRTNSYTGQHVSALMSATIKMSVRGLYGHNFSVSLTTKGPHNLELPIYSRTDL